MLSEMFRCTLAIISLLLFIVFLVPFFIVGSVMKGLFQEQAMVSSIIPASYEVMIPLLAAEAAKTPDESELFLQRMNIALPREVYTEILSAVVSPLFETFHAVQRGEAVPNDINLTALQQAIRKHLPAFMQRLPICESQEISQEKFRFCRPAQSEGKEKMEQGMLNVIDKELPSRMPISPEGRVFLDKTLHPFLVSGAYISWIGLGIAALMLGLQAWVVQKHGYPAILKWNGASIFLLSSVLIIFLISMERLPEMLAAQNVLSVPERSWLVFFMAFPLRTLWVWAMAVSIIGASLFIFGTVQAKQKKSS